MALLRSPSRAGLLAFVLGAAASSTLIAARVTHGASTVAYPGILVLAILALLLSWEARRFTEASGRHHLVVVAQVVGAAAAVAVAHGVLAVVHPAGLVEAPRQLVNDAVLVGTIAAFSWASAAHSTRARMALAAVAGAILIAYRATSARWHCDVISFALPIQQIVVAAVLLVAMFLLMVDLRPRS